MVVYARVFFSFSLELLFCFFFLSSYFSTICLLLLSIFPPFVPFFFGFLILFLFLFLFRLLQGLCERSGTGHRGERGRAALHSQLLVPLHRVRGLQRAVQRQIGALFATSEWLMEHDDGQNKFGCGGGRDCSWCAGVAGDGVVHVYANSLNGVHVSIPTLPS